MTVYGYTRVSTRKQKIERQIENIKRKFPSAIIVSERFTGTTLDRPAWQRLMKNVKKGDTIVFDEVSRMARNAEEGFTAYQRLFEAGINLVFLKEPHLNTETYRKALESTVPMTNTDVDCILRGINQYLMQIAKTQIQIAFEQAQHEVDYIHQRTSEGIQIAKLKGKRVGTPKGTKLTTKKGKRSKSVILQHCKDFGGTLNDAECQQLCGISRNSYYKYKRELKQEQQNSEKAL